MNLFIKLLVVVVFFLPCPSMGGEGVLETMRQMYPSFNFIKVTPAPTKIAIGVPTGAGSKFFSSLTIFTATTGASYEASKTILAEKGIDLVEMARCEDETTPVKATDKKATEKKDTGLNPWKIDDYHASLGKNDEGWQFILMTHRFDSVTKEWKMETNLQIIVPGESSTSAVQIKVEEKASAEETREQIITEEETEAAKPPDQKIPEVTIPAKKPPEKAPEKQPAKIDLPPKN